MREIALKINGVNIEVENYQVSGALRDNNLGQLLSVFLNYGFPILGIVMFIWAAWGIFQYITAGSSKEEVAKARARITWAVIGFLFTMISYGIAQYFEDILIR